MNQRTSWAVFAFVLLIFVLFNATGGGPGGFVLGMIIHGDVRQGMAGPPPSAERSGSGG